MRYNLLGFTGVRVSELCLGAMTFGGKGGAWDAIGALDEAASTRLVSAAIDRGVNFFDTADAYAGGESEEILGRALRPHRADVIITTKLGFPMGDRPNQRGLSRLHVRAAVDASLRRLGTDYIDLYLLHTRDVYTPIEETLRALDDEVRAGRIRYIGVSNFAAWEIVKANGLAQAAGWTRFCCVQANYNLVARDLERELGPMMSEEKLGLMVWSPLAGGALSGKFSADGRPPAGSRRESFDVGPVDYTRLNAIMEVARPLAKKLGVSVPRVTLAWLLAQPVVTSVIVGAKRMEQLEDNLGAIDVKLEAEDLAALTAASELPVEYPGWYIKQFAGV